MLLPVGRNESPESTTSSTFSGPTNPILRNARSGSRILFPSRARGFPNAVLKTSWPEVLMNVKIILDDQVTQRSVRADLAWELFFKSKTEMPKGHGEPLLPFANWFWDEMGQRAGRLLKYSKGEATVTVPPLAPEALDFVVRLASFWSDEVYLRKRGSLSGNMWRRPVVNVFDDDTREGAERALASRKEPGSIDRFLMPLLGPGRAFFRIRVVEKDESAARFHSHSHVDEYYLILTGKGTLRYNGSETEVKSGDLIGKPAEIGRASCREA